MRVRVVALAFCVAFSLCSIGFGQSEDSLTSNQRIVRIRELGKKDARAIPNLAEFLSDPDRDIRIEAVKSIIRLGTEASLAPLIRATHDNDPEVQIRATDGLVNYYLPGYSIKSGLTGPLTRGVRQVKSFFSSRNDQVIDADIMVRPDVSQALADEIGGGASVDARSNAALAAGILRARPAVSALVQALRSKDSQIIFESLVAIQKIGDPTAGPGVASVTHDLDDRVQATALETVGVLRSVNAAPDVRSALQHARTMRVRKAALEALAMLGLNDDRPVFLQYLQDKDADLRSSALEGLGRIREPQDFTGIQDAYNEQNAEWRVHLAAAFALVDEGKIDTAEFSPLPYLVESLDIKARSDVASAYLTELVRRDDVRKALLPMVSQSTKDQKIAFCAILGASPNGDVIPTLTALSRDADADVAFAASRSMRLLRSHGIS